LNGPSRAAALEDGEYKCISPSFWPACLGEWYDPEDSEQTARNVLVGAGLTNIPFFKDLTAIMASRSSDNDGKSKNVIYIKADKEQKTMTLDEVRVLDADKLNDEQKQILIAHKEELSAEERTKFATVLTADNDAGDGGDGSEGDGR
jgi:5-deoxy-D-glucuronate isomerase